MDYQGHAQRDDNFVKVNHVEISIRTPKPEVGKSSFVEGCIGSNNR